MDGVRRDQPVKVFGTCVICVQVVLVALWGSFQQLGVSFPKQLLQPHCMDGTRGHGGAAATWHRQSVCQFRDGQHVLTGQDGLKGGQRVRQFICQLTVIQTCDRDAHVENNK